MDEVTLMGIAAQLRKPAGEYALRTGEMMNVGNALINGYAIAATDPMQGDHILEIGMGNGYFVRDLLAKASDISYTGLDYSPEMVNAARLINKDIGDEVSFVCGSATRMPFEDACFNKIFTVNTLYFWDDRQKVINEIKRVLQPGGVLIIAIRPGDEMKHYPMTKWGFKMYTEETLRAFLDSQGFSNIELNTHSEPEQEIAGEMRPVSTLIAKAILVA